MTTIASTKARRGRSSSVKRSKKVGGASFDKGRSSSSARQPLSAKHKTSFHFSPFGTAKSRERELKQRLSREREGKQAKIKQEVEN